MSWLSKAVKAVGNVVKDVAKVSIALPLESYGSLTGDKHTITYQTGLGATFGKGATGGLVAVHGAAKGFANAVTYGYATKATNLLRPADKKETAGSYKGSIVNKGKSGSSAVDKLNNFSLEGGKAIGSIYGAKVSADVEKAGGTVGTISKGLGVVSSFADMGTLAGESLSASGGNGTLAADNQQSGSVSPTTIGIVVVVLGLIIVLIKKFL